MAIKVNFNEKKIDTIIKNDNTFFLQKDNKKESKS